MDAWLPEDRFARFVIAVVGAIDLSAFYADDRADGHGRPAHDPAMVVAPLVCAQRSSRVVERGCLEEVALRVVSANRQPDHTTIAGFRRRHERAWAPLFGRVLGLCAHAGLADVAVLAVDEGARQRVRARDARRPAARRRGSP